MSRTLPLNDLFSGLSIQTVSESVSYLEGIVKEMEVAQRILMETCSEVDLFCCY